MLRQLQRDPQIAALMRNPGFLNALRNPEQFARMLQGAVGDGGSGGGAPFGFQERPWPAISREIFDDAMECLNGAPLPPRYANAMATAGAGPAGGPRQEYISRATVNAALDTALGLNPSTDGSASTGGAPGPAEPMDTTDTAPAAQGTAVDGATMDAAPDAPAAQAPDEPQQGMDSQPDPEPAAPAQTDLGQPEPTPHSETAAMDTTTATDPLAGQIQQLAAMGFSNEAMSRQALEAAGGDIMLAIEFLTASM